MDMSGQHFYYNDYLDKQNVDWKDYIDNTEKKQPISPKLKKQEEVKLN